MANRILKGVFFINLFNRNFGREDTLKYLMSDSEGTFFILFFLFFSLVIIIIPFFYLFYFYFKKKIVTHVTLFLLPSFLFFCCFSFIIYFVFYLFIYLFVHTFSPSLCRGIFVICLYQRQNPNLSLFKLCQSLGNGQRKRNYCSQKISSSQTPFLTFPTLFQIKY